MINKFKKHQVEEIRQYIEDNADLYNKLIIFGKSIDPNSTIDDDLEVAVSMANPEDAEDDEAQMDLFCTIDEITNGKFDLVIINSSENSNNIIGLVNKGEIIYG